VIEKNISDCSESLFTALTNTSRWRETLSGRYTEPRNGKAAERLAIVGNRDFDVTGLSNYLYLLIFYTQAALKQTGRA
jgi:hypothetical protein